MPTPVGHSLFALSVYMIAKGKPLERRDVGGVIIAAALTNLPDIDFTPIVIYGFRAVKMFHQAYTHNLGFCLASSIVIALLAAPFLRKKFIRLWPLVFMLVYAHVLLDALGNDLNPPRGVQLLWPLTERYFMFPLPVFIGVAKSTFRELFSLWNFLAVLLELVIFVPIIGISAALNKWRVRPKQDGADVI